MPSTWIASLLLAQVIAPDPRITPDSRRFLLLKSESVPRGPLPLHAVAPVFPIELVASIQVTTVVVDVVIDEQGRVRSAIVVEGNGAKAREAAMRAAPQWLFEPSVGGMPQRPVRLSFTFRTLPEWAPEDELTTSFSNKYEVEVRRKVAPRPTKP
jgi:TonB family protein